MSEYQKGIVKQLIVLFTGAGKTFLLIRLLEKMGFKRVLWLSFQEELVSQSGLAFIKEKFDESFYNHVKEVGFIEYIRNGGLFSLNDFKMGLIKADVFKPEGNVVMGSVMTVARRLDKLPADYFDCIVCDESHLFGSTQAVNTINHFTPNLLIGCTATPLRSDGVMLCDIFQKITFEYGLDKGIKDKWCAELDAIRVKTTISLDSVKTTAGEFNQKDLSNEVNTQARNQLIVEKWTQHAKGRQTIAFCVNIQHAIDLAEQFKLNGINAVAVSSDEELTPDRSENIEAYKEGKIQVLTNVAILVAGFDAPDTGCAIMAAPTKSLTRYLQSVGRAARLKSDKYVAEFGQNAIIMDVVDNTSRHNLINAWELDKQKPLEDRVFVTQANKEKILLDRQQRSVKLTHHREEDEVVNLLRLPEYKIAKSWRMEEPATEAQLKSIEKWGYDIVNNHYTKSMISEIFGQQSATAKQISFLKFKGYNVDGPVSVAVANMAFKEIREKEEKQKRKEQNEKIKSNNPFKF